jgi:hypothetical protein
MASFAPLTRHLTHRNGSISHAIRTGRLHNASGNAAQDLLILGTGQSNMANWSSSTFSTAGQTSLLTTLDSIDTRATHAFVNAGNGGSFLLRSAFNTANTRYGGTLEAGDYWLDNTGSSLSAGQRLTDMLTILAAAGRSVHEVTHILWSQGESDAAEIYLGNISSGEYYTALAWLKDYCLGLYQLT